MLCAVVFVIATAASAAPGPDGPDPAAAPPPQAPANAEEGAFVEVDGEIFKVHGGRLYALDDPALDDGHLTIAVTGSRADKKARASTVTVVTSADIAESAARTLADVLREQPGVQVNDAFGLTQEVSLDGLDGRQVLVLVNGRPVKGRVDSRIDVGRIPVDASSIDRIEIVHGPASALYGSEALGGVINIVTKKPQAALGGEVDVGTELVPDPSLTLWPQAAAHGHGGAGPLAVRVDVNWQQMPGIDRDKNGKADVPNRRQAGLHAETALALLDDASFTAQIDGMASETVASTSPAARFSERDSTNDWSAAGRYAVDVTAHGEVSLDVRVDRVTRVFDKLPAGSGPPPSYCGGLFDAACPRAPQVNTVATESEGRLELVYTDDLASWLTTSVGGVVTREQAVRVNGDHEDTLPGGGERDVASLYAEASLAPTSWLTIVPGARVDAFTPGNAGEHAALAPKLAVAADVGAGVTVKASYGRGFRLPSFEERFLKFDHSELGYIVLGNPDLLAEKSDGFRAGVSWAPLASVSLSTETYLNLVDNLVTEGEPTGTVNDIPVFTYKNAARAYTSGINVTTSVGPFFGFRLDGGYQYLINAVDASACPDHGYFCDPSQGARSLPLLPAHSLDAALRYRLDATGTVLFVRGDGRSERPISATETAPASFTMDAGVRQPINFTKETGLELTLTVVNVTDSYDAKFGPKPGRAVSLLLRLWN